MTKPTLIERLRTVAKDYNSRHNALVHEAADEIERLQSAINEKRESLMLTLQELDRAKAANKLALEALGNCVGDSLIGGIQRSAAIAAPKAAGARQAHWEHGGAL